MIIGDFLDSGYPEQLCDIYKEISDKLDIPVCTGFRLTHNKDKITIPYGRSGEINSGRLIVE
jgi:muramoyltetrapeptide carboxypeptidase LdcA involved in peptidoglycan recycling